MNRKAKPEPAQARQRHLLARIREADFPRDFDKFSSQELKAAGLFDKYKPPSPKFEGPIHRLFVLFATQVDELREERDQLRIQLANHSHYYSPLWNEVHNEACPIKKRELRRKAEADDATVNAQREEARDPFVWFRKPAATFRDRPWESRDKKRPFFHFEPTLWHEPMTIQDYANATGLSRRTASNIVRRLKAKPLTARKRLNEPAEYGAESNFAVLREWLTRYVKDVGQRKAFTVCTLLHCKHAARPQLRTLFAKISPAIPSLNIDSKSFLEYFFNCERLLHPPNPEPGFDQSALGISGFVKMLQSKAV